MKLGVYFNSLQRDEKKKFITLLSGSLSKSEVTIRSYINGNRNIQPEEAKKITAATDGNVTTAELCPRVFGDAA